MDDRNGKKLFDARRLASVLFSTLFNATARQFHVSVTEGKKRFFRSLVSARKNLDDATIYMLRNFTYCVNDLFQRISKFQDV